MISGRWRSGGTLSHNLDEVERHLRLPGVSNAVQHIGFCKDHVPCPDLRGDSVDGELSGPLAHDHDLFLNVAVRRMGLRSRNKRDKSRGKCSKLLRRPVEVHVGFRTWRVAFRAKALRLYDTAQKQGALGFRIHMGDLLP